MWDQWRDGLVCFILITFAASFCMTQLQRGAPVGLSPFSSAGLGQERALGSGCHCPSIACWRAKLHNCGPGLCAEGLKPSCAFWAASSGGFHGAPPLFQAFAELSSASVCGPRQLSGPELRRAASVAS